MSMTRRYQILLPIDVADKFEAWADKLGLAYSQLGSLALQAGLDSVMRAVSPLDSISVDKLAELVQVLEARGMNVSAEVKSALVTKKPSPKKLVTKKPASKKAVKRL